MEWSGGRSCSRPGSELARRERTRSPRERAPGIRALVQPLHDHRLAHAAGDAHRLEAYRAVEGVEVVEQRGHDARAGHPERVAEGDRAAERVELLGVDAPLVAA